MGKPSNTYPAAIGRSELLALCAYAANAERQFGGLVEQSLTSPYQLPQPACLETTDQVMEALRRHRASQSLHVLWQDLNGQMDVEQVGKALSNIARGCLSLALASAEQETSAQHGQLIGDDGEPLSLSVIGMGKLGGDELNFNSDIDLVMTHRTTGKATGPRGLDAGQYLALVAQGLIKRMETVTPHGRVWVVDMRLRPFGQTGALVWSLPAMEDYFLAEGRTWERYAWLKAAHVAGDPNSASELLKSLRPFIYRRYLDYGIFDSLRSLHQKIDGQSQRLGGKDDIKRGPGGIRALEFLVQSLQLLEGGRTPDLQVPGFLPALTALEQAGFLDGPSAQSMRTAYGFLRTLENRLQAMTGRQTHQLPTPGPQLDHLAQLMGFDHANALMAQLKDYRDWVATEFHGRFADKGANQPSALSWPPGPDLADQLRACGMSEDIEKVVARLELLAKRIAKRPLSREGRLRLDRFLPKLIEQIAQQPNPHLGLEEMLSLIEQIAQRSAYVALLYERPEITKQVVKAFRASERIARWVIESPQLLDDLIDPQHSQDMPVPPKIDPNDLEAGLNRLGRWRQTTFLKTALAELNHSISTEKASQYLTQVADTCIQTVLEGIGEDAPLAVIAYGNTGAGTMHYASDLDCVFLHPHDHAPRNISKIAQRLISMVQLPLPGGRLFEIDTRLRPNGRAGLLVSDIEQFRLYQRDKAWLWESQALIRARWMAGDPALKATFDAIRKEVLMQPRDSKKTAQALQEMRKKQRLERKEGPIKKRINDLQFLAEFGVLTQAHGNEALLEARSPDQQLPLLEMLDSSLCAKLVASWQTLHQALHHQWLDRVPVLPEQTALDQMDEAIDAAWQGMLS